MIILDPTAAVAQLELQLFWAMANEEWTPIGAWSIVVPPVISVSVAFIAAYFIRRMARPSDVGVRSFLLIAAYASAAFMVSAAKIRTMGRMDWLPVELLCIAASLLLTVWLIWFAFSARGTSIGAIAIFALFFVVVALCYFWENIPTV